MTKHSQDKGSSFHRAFMHLDAKSLKYALERQREANAKQAAARDRQVAASALYEELRLLSKDELAKRAGFTAPKNQLIAAIIEREVPE